MNGNIWVIAERWQDETSDATYEMLALGRELADGLGVRCEVLVLGPEGKEALGTLGAADGVIAIEGGGLEPAIGTSAARAIAAVMADRQPGAVLLPITNVSWDLIGLLPAMSGASLVNLCREVAVAGDGLRATSVLYGGKMEATVDVAAGPAVLAVLPGIRSADVGKVPGDVDVESVVLEPGPKPKITLLDYIEPEAGDVDITQQEVLIGIGRGIENDANVEVAEELAEALGGAVCGSRPVIDQGWLTLDRQVGKSGLSVKPRFYIAAGISGAPEHTEGMKDAELILAVNTDPDAPIFSVAHYGIVEDATDVLEALAEAITERKG